MEEINWADFEKVDLRVGTILEAVDFPKAKKPAYQLVVDFGEEIGIRTDNSTLHERESDRQTSRCSDQFSEKTNR